MEAIVFLRQHSVTASLIVDLAVVAALDDVVEARATEYIAQCLWFYPALVVENSCNQYIRLYVYARYRIHVRT